MSNPILLSKEHDVTAFASNDPTRYVLNGVHYDAKGGFVEATNGRQLIRVPVATSDEFPPVTGSPTEPVPDCIVPIAPLKKAMASIPNGKSLPILKHVALTAVMAQACGVVDPGKARLTTNDLDTENSAIVKTVEGNFPNTSQVIPDKPAKFKIALSAFELGIICEYCAKHGKGDAAGIVCEFTDQLEPMKWRITTKEGREVFGILMPVHTE